MRLVFLSPFVLALVATSCGTPAATAPAHGPALPPPATSRPEPAAAARPRPTGPTIAKGVHDLPGKGSFLPDGRFVAFTGGEAFVADPRSTEPLRGLRRFILRKGETRIAGNGAHYLRIGGKELGDLDTATFTERKKLTFEGTILYAVPNRRGTLALVHVGAHPGSGGHEEEVLVDLATFRVLRTFPLASSGTATVTDDGKYLVVHPHEGLHRTVVLEASSGTEVFRAKEGHLDVVGSFVVDLAATRDTVVYEDLATHKKAVTKLPCKGPIARLEDRVAVACGAKLMVFPLVSGSKATTVVAPAAIRDLGADGPELEVRHERGVSRLEGDKLVAAACVGRTSDGREVARGPHLCGATLSPDGAYLTRNGIRIERVSDGEAVLDVPWGLAGNRNASAVVHDNVVGSYDLVAGGTPGLAIPFDGPSPRTKYLPLAREGKLELFDVTTRHLVATLPIETQGPRVLGDGDEVVVHGSGASSSFARCSIAKATCTSVEGAPCAPAGFANGRGICLETRRDGTQLTRFVLGSPSETRTLVVPERVGAVFPAGKAFWLTATRGDSRNLEAFVAHVTDTSFDGASIAWKKVPFPILAISGDVAIAGGAGLSGTPPYGLLALSSAETSQLVPYARGAIRIYEDGRVAFWGEREEAERDLLCVDGDRVRTWSDCKDREVGW